VYKNVRGYEKEVRLTTNSSLWHVASVWIMTSDVPAQSRAAGDEANITSEDQQQQDPHDDYHRHHTAVVLFYKYFLPDPAAAAAAAERLPLIQQYPDYYVPQLQQFVKDLCSSKHFKGRILVAAEGVNGTVSAADLNTLQTQFIRGMEALDLVRDFGLPPGVTSANDADGATSFSDSERRLFQGVDWKISSTAAVSNDDTQSTSPILEPFPDLKVSVVPEIISTGGAVSVQDVQQYGGTHLSPQEFHQCLLQDQDQQSDNKVVLIDVRNTFEHAIGHFVDADGRAARNPETVTFSSFDATFAARHAEELRDAKVLLYCTVR